MKTAIVIALVLVGGVLSLMALCAPFSYDKPAIKVGNIPVITIPRLERDFWPNQFVIKEDEDESARLPESIEPI